MSNRKIEKPKGVLGWYEPPDPDYIASSKPPKPYQTEAEVAPEDAEFDEYLVQLLYFYSECPKPIHSSQFFLYFNHVSDILVFEKKLKKCDSTVEHLHFLMGVTNRFFELMIDPDTKKEEEVVRFLSDVNFD